MLSRGILILAPEALDSFPFGVLLHAPAPGLLVPLGQELRPAVSPDELAVRVGATGGAVVVFPGPREAPFRVSPESIRSLQALALADPNLVDLPFEEAVGTLADTEEPPDIQIENKPLGPMPLWRVGR